MKYKNSAYEDKLNDLIFPPNGGTVINVDTVFDRDSNCELNRFINIMNKKGPDGSGENEGFTVLIAAATGVAAGSIPNEGDDIGEPLQVSAIAYTLNDDGTVEAMPKKAVINFNIEVSAQAADNAEKLGIFKDAGIDTQRYKSNTKGYVHTKQETLDKLDTFFEKFSPESYPVISNGRIKEHTTTLSQEILGKLGSLKAFESEMNIDFTQVIKEYSYRAYYDDDYDRNAILNEETAASFELEDVVESDPEMVNALTGGQRSKEDMLVSTKQKVFAVAMLADEIRMHNIELTDPILYKELTKDHESNDDEEETSEKSITGTGRKFGDGKYDEDIARILMGSDEGSSGSKRDVVIVEGDDARKGRGGNSIDDIMAERSRRANERLRAQQNDMPPYYLPERARNIETDSGRPFYLPRRESSSDDSGRPFYLPRRESSSDDSDRPFYLPRRESSSDDSDRPFYLPRRESSSDDSDRPFFLPRRDNGRMDAVRDRPYYLPRRESGGDRLFQRPGREDNPGTGTNDEVKRLISVIEEQQKMMERKDAMIASSNEAVMRLTEKLSDVMEQQAALLEKLIDKERQREDE